MIRIENVSKSFGSFKALDGLTLRAGEGTVLGLLGPNGSGKTTTVKILTTLLARTAGTHGWPGTPSSGTGHGAP